jgi:hypothetical protein
MKIFKNYIHQPEPKLRIINLENNPLPRFHNFPDFVLISLDLSPCCSGQFVSLPICCCNQCTTGCTAPNMVVLNFEIKSISVK